jgi:hypothetical protein
MNKSTLELHTNSIVAYSNYTAAEDSKTTAEAAFHRHCNKLIKAGIMPTHYQPYWNGGQESKGRNEKCTASRMDADQIAHAFLDTHKDRDEIMMYRSLTSEQKDNITRNDLKALANVAKGPNSKRSSMMAKFQKYVDKLEKAALVESAKSDPAAADKLDATEDKGRRDKDLAALATIQKRAANTLRDGQMIEAKAAFKTLMEIYNS